jgi:hypothetical protein
MIKLLWTYYTKGLYLYRYRYELDIRFDEKWNFLTEHWEVCSKFDGAVS